MEAGLFVDLEGTVHKGLGWNVEMWSGWQLQPAELVRPSG